MVQVPPPSLTAGAKPCVGVVLSTAVTLAIPEVLVVTVIAFVFVANVQVSVGVTVSTVKLVEPPDPALPLFSCQLLAVTLTEPVPSVLDAPVQVAV